MRFTVVIEKDKALGYILFCIFFLVCFVSNTRAASDMYGAEKNPTGDPIGGGIGYRNIISPSVANYVVSNKTELLSALSSATSGQIIYIDDNARIDLTGEKNIKIPANVTLSSGRGQNGSEGALIYTNEYYSSLYPFLLANGEKVRLTGLCLIGPDMEIGDHHYSGPYFLARGIQSGYPYLEVDNCELAGWGHAAILLTEGATDAYIHHNYIHHNRRSGLGYGVCHGYCTELKPINSVIEANIFDYCRHHIAGTGTSGESYEARYNLCLEHDNGHSFDMHGGADRGDGTDIAGDWIKIYQNTFRDRDVSAVGIRGIPRYEAQIHNNWFYHDDAAQAIFQSNAFGNMTVYDNFYGINPPLDTMLPVSLPKSSHISGPGPLSVFFDGLSSYDINGSIVDYVWYFGDGNSAIGNKERGQQANYTFNDPGRYNVILEVKDNQGIPSINIIPITVTPAAGNCVLSLWVKDSYRGSLGNYYQKEVLLDGVVVWSDDVEGDEGWVHVLKDVSAQVAGKDQVTLGLRIHCVTGVTDPANEIIEIFTYWDDVVLFGFDVKNGDFESSGDWDYSENGSIWRGWRYTGDIRSGYYTYMISCPYMETTNTNSWSQIEQVVVNTPPAVITQTPIGSNVLTNANISATFSEPMNRTSTENAFFISPSVEGKFQWEGNTIVFNPDVYFKYEETYTVSIDTGANDLAGKNMAVLSSWQFTTLNQPPEEKINVYPNPYVKGKSLNEIISFANLPKEATIRIYTLSGELVKEIDHKDTVDGGIEEWDISGIAGGVYVYTIVFPGGKKTGKISIVK